MNTLPDPLPIGTVTRFGTIEGVETGPSGDRSYLVADGFVDEQTITAGLYMVPTLYAPRAMDEVERNRRVKEALETLLQQGPTFAEATKALLVDLGIDPMAAARMVAAMLGPHP